MVWPGVTVVVLSVFMIDRSAMPITEIGLDAPLIAGLTVSATVMTCGPFVLKVAKKMPTPFVNVALAGNTAAGSLLVKWIVPL